MFNSLKIPLSFLILGLCWAFSNDPVITALTRQLPPGRQDVFRALNDFIFFIIAAFVLYVQIKRQQSKLIRSEEEYRHLFESNPNPMWIYNNETLGIIKVNDAAVEKYRYNRSEFLKMSIYDIRPKEDREKFDNYLEEKKALKGGHRGIRMAGIWRHLKATGEVFNVSVVSHPVLFGSRNCTMVAFADMTELLEKETQLEGAYQKIKASNETLLKIAWANSHQVRKPLCSILSLVDLMRQATGELERDEFLTLLEICSMELDQVLKDNNEKISEAEMAEVS